MAPGRPRFSIRPLRCRTRIREARCERRLLCPVSKVLTGVLYVCSQQATSALTTVPNDAYAGTGGQYKSFGAWPIGVGRPSAHVLMLTCRVRILRGPQ